MDSSSVPTENEIAALPQWAKVAFAVRCAQRVLPMLSQLWPDGTRGHLPALEATVAEAEVVAQTGKRDAAVYNSVQLGAVNAAHHIAGQARRLPKDISDAVFVVAAAHYAAYTEAPAQWAATTAKAAARAAELLSIPTAPLIRADFESLKNKVATERWTDATTVSQGVFGPLWPDELVPSLAMVAGATERLQGLMGRYSADATVDWRFADGSYPPGLRVRVSAWGGSRARVIPWHGLTDDRNVDAALALLWSGVLGMRIEQSSALPLAITGG